MVKKYDIHSGEFPSVINITSRAAPLRTIYGKKVYYTQWRISLSHEYHFHLQRSIDTSLRGDGKCSSLRNYTLYKSLRAGFCPQFFPSYLSGEWELSGILALENHVLASEITPLFSPHFQFQTYSIQLLKSEIVIFREVWDAYARGQDRALSGVRMIFVTWGGTFAIIV